MAERPTWKRGPASLRPEPGPQPIDGHGGFHPGHVDARWSKPPERAAAATLPPPRVLSPGATPNAARRRRHVDLVRETPGLDVFVALGTDLKQRRWTNSSEVEHLMTGSLNVFISRASPRPRNCAHERRTSKNERACGSPYARLRSTDRISGPLRGRANLGLTSQAGAGGSGKVRVRLMKRRLLRSYRGPSARSGACSASFNQSHGASLNSQKRCPITSRSSIRWKSSTMSRRRRKRNSDGLVFRSERAGLRLYCSHLCQADIHRAPGALRRICASNTGSSTKFDQIKRSARCGTNRVTEVSSARNDVGNQSR